MVELLTSRPVTTLFSTRNSLPLCLALHGKCQLQRHGSDLAAPLTHGLQFDFNYTYSKSIDLSSDAERIGTFGGLGAQIINTWSPNQFRGGVGFRCHAPIQRQLVWNFRLVGKRQFLSSPRFTNAIVGGWQLSGIFRLTSGFPSAYLTAHSGRRTGNLAATRTRPLPLRLATTRARPNPTIVVNTFGTGIGCQTIRPTFPGRAASAISRRPVISAWTWVCRSAGPCRSAKNTACSSAGKFSTSPIPSVSMSRDHDSSTAVPPSETIRA